MLLTVPAMVDDTYWAKQPDVLSVHDLARILRKTTVTIWRWLQEGRIPAHNIAGSWIVYRDALQQRLEHPDIRHPLPLEFLARFPDELTMNELAQIFGKTKQTVWRWLADGKMPGVGTHLDRNWIIYKHDVLRLLEATSNAPASRDTP